MIKLKDIQKKNKGKTAFISARVMPENAKWFKENKIDFDLLIEKLRDANLGADE